MRKLTILAMVATLLMAGSAFAVGRNLVAQPNATFPAGSPATTNNDDSCDIGVAPAATLLLPYFEVDVANAAGTGRTTNFTVTNVSGYPQIAHVTVWTDWSFPVLDFNVFLTGYDVQSINLYDVLVRGIVAPSTGASDPAGTSSSTTVGLLSFANTSNPNIQAGAVGPTGTCSTLPGTLPDTLVAAVRSALTTGIYRPGFGVDCGASVRVGGTHANAVGYVTIDVANTCSTNFPDNPAYIQTELLFDNVLIGEYLQIDQAIVGGNNAMGNPMVHIRAIPEGGPAGQAAVVTNLPYTYYDRYTTALTGERADRRQPLPSTFAARFIQGGVGATNTSFKIWREGVTLGTQTCGGAASNSALTVRDIVRFDESENPFGFGTGLICSPCGPGGIPPLPETSNYQTSSSQFPSPTGTDAGGWMYLNLSQATPPAGFFSAVDLDPSTAALRPSQNWVVVSMAAEGRFAADFDAAWLGNGCSAGVAPTSGVDGEVAPAGGVLVCPPGATGCTAGVAPYTGTNVTP